MPIGPYPGNGFSWQHGPFTLGVWVVQLPQGFGESLVLGHKENGQWFDDGNIYDAGDDGGWEAAINQYEQGKIGTFWVEFLIPRINAQVDALFQVNPDSLPGAPPITNDSQFTLDLMNGLIAQFTDSDAATGHLKQKGT